jgi:two-component system, response regulator PdtaR
VRMFASDFLDEAGFKVFEVVNADEALAVLTARPDVQATMTDIEMPGSMNGIELAKVVRERWPGMRTILTSGRSNPGPTICPTTSPSSPSPSCPRRSSTYFDGSSLHRSSIRRARSPESSLICKLEPNQARSGSPESGPPQESLREGSVIVAIET